MLKRNCGKGLQALAVWAGIAGSGEGLAASVVLPIHEPFQSARSAGMAGAGIAMADGEEAIFLNPAGIGSLDDAKLDLRGFAFPNFTAGANSSSFQMFEKYVHEKESRIEKLEEAMTSKGSDVLYARASLFPTFTLWRFQLGLLLDGDTQGYRVFTTEPKGTTPAQGRIEAWERSQAGVVAGFSAPYKNTGWSAGIAGRYSYRTTVFQDVDMVDGKVRRTSRSLLSGLNRTRGGAVDIGVLYTSLRAWVPSCGISLRDAADTLYKGATASDSSEREKMALGIALASSPWAPQKGATRFRVTAEGHHLNDDRLALRDKFRFGGELLMGEHTTTSPFSVRIGHNLRGFSYGATLDAIFAKIEAGSYVEAVSGSDGTRLDRRSFVRLSVDLRH